MYIPLEQVREGEITTLRDFALMAARDFDYLHDVEYMPPPALPYTIQPRIYFLNAKIAEQEAELARMRAMNLTDARRAAIQDYTKKWNDRQTALRRNRIWIRNAIAMRQKVRLWKPPTKMHRGLKTYMLEHLDKWAKNIDAKTFYPKPPKPGPDWYANEVAEIEAEIERLRQERDAEVKRAEAATAWLKELRASLA